MPMIWTTTADEIVIAGWKAGDPMGHIVAKLIAAGFPGVNKNMVVGRRWRLSKQTGLERPTKPQVSNLPRTTPRATRVLSVTRRERQFVSHGDGVAYMKLRDGCKAILDKRGPDGLLMCCGKQRVTLNGDALPTPYCDDHHRIYNNPQTPKDGEKWRKQQSSVTM
jgi:hypothetical protein